MFLFQVHGEAVKQVLSKRDGVIAGAIGFPIAIFVIGVIVVLLIAIKRRGQKDIEQERRRMRTSIPATYPRSQFPQPADRHRHSLAGTRVTTSMVQPNQSEHPDDFVPPYTASANENDMGYYDSEGKFHTIDYIKPPALPPAVYTR
ncbi:Protein RCR1 [Candida viswanathii]|uniref:Protein RCR1 n=1 Tax=Candida viswanathii TaxID=5486 RepID=A0A367YNL0_9ASCO|nr:Protein RCR1 [Candida viswanathii]